MSVSAPTYIYPPLSADAGTLYQGFVTYMQANVPGWQPYSTKLDDWLARVFASIQSSLTDIASDVATQIYRYFGANIVNVPPFEAVSAIGTVTITVQDANGPYDIPAFTQMSFPDATGTLQGFETTTDLTIANGDTEATGVFVQAITSGSSGNGCVGAGDLDGSAPITYITGLEMTTASSQGSDAETDAAYLNRLTALFTTLTPTPVTAQSFTVIAASQQGVGRATTIRTFNPGAWEINGTLTSASETVTVSSSANIPVGAPVSGTDIPTNTYVTGTPTSTTLTLSAAATGSGSQTLTFTGQLNQGGYVSTWVTDISGEPLSSDAMAIIQAAIQAQCLSNVRFNVLAPTQTDINVVVNLVAWPGVDPTAMQTTAEAALGSYLLPANFGQNLNPAVASGQPSQGWLIDPVVRMQLLENVLLNLAGTHYISSLTINGAAADLPLPGVVPLTQPGTLTVNVTNG